jgi:hypothetical protein
MERILALSCAVDAIRAHRLKRKGRSMWRL